MIGGGVGSNIGEVHRKALALDGKLELVAGVFSRNPDFNAQLAQRLGLQRTYADALEMAKAESALADGVELVVIATPDASHHLIAKAFLENGISVACEKPLTQSSGTARELVQLAKSKNLVLAVAHVYSAYAMVREAAELVRRGDLGDIRLVDVQHASGWAATKLEDDGNLTVVWRMSPETATYASVAADLGTHAFHLARYISGLEISELTAELSTLVPGRRVADNLISSLHFGNGAKGRMWATMAATGNNHGLRIKVYGSQASLEWEHEDPHHLVIRDLSGEKRILAQGMANLSEAASRITRTGLGHPEGFIEAFANYYSDVADDVLRIRRGEFNWSPESIYPSGLDGLKGTLMVEAVEKSHSTNGAWTNIDEGEK
jgi:predicted dehydrogenase